MYGNTEQHVDAARGDDDDDDDDETTTEIERSTLCVLACVRVLVSSIGMGISFGSCRLPVVGPDLAATASVTQFVSVVVNRVQSGDVNSDGRSCRHLQDTFPKGCIGADRTKMSDDSKVGQKENTQKGHVPMTPTDEQTE